MSLKQGSTAVLAAAVMMGLFTFGGCNTAQTDTDVAAGNAETVVQMNAGALFSEKTLAAWDGDAEIHEIVLSDDGIKADKNTVTVDGTTITILYGGAYHITGTLGEGNLVIDTDKSADVKILFDGAHITSSTDAALYVAQAGDVFLYTADGTENTLASYYDFSQNTDSNVDAAVFSKDDLTLSGTGSLVVVSAYGHGIVSKDDLYVVSGDYSVSAAEHGLCAKDSVNILDGTFTVDCGKDGIHAENNDDAALGSVYLLGGTYDVTATGDGISASNILQIDGGDYTIVSGGGAANAAAHTEEDFGMGGRGGWFSRGGEVSRGDEQTDSSAGETEDTSVTDSFKGLKAGTELRITDGTFSLDTSDDALHANGNVTVAGGSFTIAAGDDGIHADDTLTVSGGEITITKSYEGLEGTIITIAGGKTVLTASDDGLNAAGGNDSSGFGGFGGGSGMDMFSSDGESCIVISGGYLSVNAGGDGIDSNGDLVVTGGETYVDGPADSANGALDYAGSGSVSGGIFIALGGSGMAMNFDDSSSQGTALIMLSAGQNAAPVTLYDADRNVLFTYAAQKTYNSVLISIPELQTGNTYTLTAGDAETEFVMQSTVYGSGMGMGGMNGGGTPDNGKQNGGFGGRGNRGDMGGNTGGGIPDMGEIPGVETDADGNAVVPDMPGDGEVPDMPDGGGQMPGGMTPPEMGGKMPGDIPGNGGM